MNPVCQFLPIARGDGDRVGYEYLVERLIHGFLWRYTFHGASSRLSFRASRHGSIAAPVTLISTSTVQTVRGPRSREIIEECHLIQKESARGSARPREVARAIHVALRRGSRRRTADLPCGVADCSCAIRHAAFHRNSRESLCDHRAGKRIGGTAAASCATRTQGPKPPENKKE